MASRPAAPANGATTEREPGALAEELNRVRDALNGLLYGAVTVIVHDGVVVQIDRTEKLRFGRSGPARRGSPPHTDSSPTRPREAHFTSRHC